MQFKSGNVKMTNELPCALIAVDNVLQREKHCLWLLLSHKILILILIPCICDVRIPYTGDVGGASYYVPSPTFLIQ